MEDRRGYPRAPIELRVEYKKVNSFLYDYTQNISKGGTFIKTDKPLTLGTEFVFRLQIPYLDGPLILRGQVKWLGTELGPGATEGDPGMGIEFIYVDEQEREKVYGRVEQLMIDQLGPLAYSKLMERTQ